MDGVIAISLVLLASALISLHAAASALALSQAAFRRRHAPGEYPTPPISILVPTRNPGPRLANTLQNLAALNYPAFEVIVCTVEHEPEVERALSAVPAPLKGRLGWSVTGHAPTPNPKVNALDSGYHAAAHDLLLMIDDNVVADAGRIQDLLPYFGGTTGLVSSVAISAKPEGFAGAFEAAFMNGYVAQRLLAGDRIGASYSMGNTLLFRRSSLERAGGIRGLADGVAEDSVIREKLAGIGLRTVLSPGHARQELGPRRFREVCDRQIRWLICRRGHARLAFALEPFCAGLATVLAASVAAHQALGGYALAAGIGTALLLFGLETATAALLRWPVTVWSFPAWLLRELTLPALWATALVRRSIIWRGNSYQPGKEAIG